MVAATIVRRVETFQPGVEEVILTASDAETYTAQTLGVVDTVHLTANSDSDAAHNATISGQTITLNLAGATDITVVATLRGTM